MYYVNTNNLDGELQSAYRSMHSTETALLKVISDIRCSIENNQVVILLLLDLSAAFDTVDYQILFDRLARQLGIKGVILKWLKSYLHSRTQMCHYRGHDVSFSSAPFQGASRLSVEASVVCHIYLTSI